MRHTHIFTTPRDRYVSASSFVTLLIGATIIAITPFDAGFAVLTHGSALARVCLLIILGLTGIHYSHLNGFVIRKPGVQPIIVASLCALGVAVYVALIDLWLFRAILPQDYVDYFHTHDLSQRLTYYMLRAFIENVLYRLFAFSTLGYILARITKQRVISFVIAMVVVQVVNVGINSGPSMIGHVTFSILIYYFFRGIVPGAIWAVLFWRFGFMAAEIGSVGCHLFLQPMLGSLL